ncbi:phage/plasmid primase, P4 family [bacterium]|nr:phage/plasmid primase, P4 family [bacterium]
MTGRQTKWAMVPGELKRERRWVCWVYEDRNAKRTKVPVVAARLFRADGGPRRASCRDPRTWRSFAEAAANANRFEGIGFMLGNGFAGIDLDRSLSANQSLEPWAAPILSIVQSYTEVSPSQHGLKILCRAHKPRDAGPKDSGNRKPVEGGEVECYWERRFFTITGQHWATSPLATTDCGDAFAGVWRQYVKPAGQDDGHRQSDRAGGLSDADLLARARTSKNGAQFVALFDQGDTSAYRRTNEDGTANDGASEADLALCNHLAFWTGGDEARIDRLFRQSALMRSKWLRDDYRDGTVQKAIRNARATVSYRKRCTNEQRGSYQASAPRGGAGDPVSASRLASAVLKADSFAVDEGNALYYFDHGRYRSKGERRIASRVKRLLTTWGQSDKWSSRKQCEVAEYIRVDAPRLWSVPPLNVLNCGNGLLDLATGEFREHDPSFLSLVQLPVQYDPDATCPAWERFVEQTFPDDALGLPWEIAAWLMTPDTSNEKALLLLGEGANGKSTYLAGLMAFLGNENCTNLSLQKLETDRFAAARLAGKLANICPDLPSAHLAGTSVFKAITGGDRIDAERKYAEGFSFDCYARLVFSANHPPQSADASPAFFRRWLCVPFARTFEGSAARNRGELDAELGAAKELSGVLNLALAALPRVRSKGLTEATSMREAMGDFRTVTDPLVVWLEREVVRGSRLLTPKRQLHSAYNEACQKAGRPVTTEKSFGSALRRFMPGVEEGQRTVGDRLQWCWVGIGLRSA